ncbi:uncharacterized protein LOC129595166 [Paramacrobiotus metropolitanus]|uniref:uncharacterized protein LOC129595166 n=1 Tax=Paramacrobiotus metropolitanus TaxID=2943436 RepID=UPI0024460BA4|nr:uncharacterized protein LOC129595166 [Paramacrobiotus metropolitanus]
MPSLFTFQNVDPPSGLDVRDEASGLFHRGFVSDSTDTTLTLDFHSPHKSPATFPLEQVFDKGEDLEDEQITSGTQVEVPYQSGEAPITWYPGKIVVGEAYAYAIVEFSVDDDKNKKSKVKELFKPDLLRNPDEERIPVDEGMFRRTEIPLKKELVEKLEALMKTKKGAERLEEVWKARGVCRADVDKHRALVVFRSGKDDLDEAFVEETVEGVEEKGTKRDAEGQEKGSASKTDEKGDAKAHHPSKTHVTVSTETFGRHSREFEHCQHVFRAVDATTKEFTFEGGESDHNDGWLLHCTLGILFGKDIHLDKLILSKTFPYFGDIIENTEDTLKINAHLAAVAKKLVIRECEVSQFIHSVMEVSSGLTDTTAVVEEAELELHGEDAVEKALAVFEEIVEELDADQKERVKKALEKNAEESLKILKKWEPKHFSKLKEADIKKVDVSSLKKLTQMAILYTFY